MRGAAHEEILGPRPPVFLHPFDIRLEAAAGRDQRRGAHRDPPPVANRRRLDEHAVLDVEVHHFGLVGDLDAERRRGAVERVEHGAATTEKERIGAPEAQRAAERGLEAHSLVDEPDPTRKSHSTPTRNPLLPAFFYLDCANV